MQFALIIQTCSISDTNKMFRPSNIHGLLLVLGLLVLSSPVFSVQRYQGSGCNGTFGRNKLYIQGFVPASGEVFTSETVVPAATLACQEVNNEPGILDDYELVIEWSDTQVRNALVRALHEHVIYHTCTIMYIDPYL